MSKELAHLGQSAQMNKKLKEEVELQLLKDLEHYGLKLSKVIFDYSGACQEGHCTNYLDGNLEDLSEVVVKDVSGKIIASGWIDFIHGGNSNPLFVFWLFLEIERDGKYTKVKDKPDIPGHLWNVLDEKTKALCTFSKEYDSRWSKDPLVIAWKKSRSNL